VDVRWRTGDVRSISQTLLAANGKQMSLSGLFSKKGDSGLI